MLGGLGRTGGGEPGPKHVDRRPPAPEPWELTGPAENDPADPGGGQRVEG